jgi:hypothetical protein
MPPVGQSIALDNLGAGARAAEQAVDQMEMQVPHRELELEVIQAVLKPQEWS